MTVSKGHIQKTSAIKILPPKSQKPGNISEVPILKKFETMIKTFVSATLLALSIATTPTYASDSFFGAIKDAGRSIGHATRDITREIGHTTRDTTKEIGHAFKKRSSDENDSDKKKNKNPKK